MYTSIYEPKGLKRAQRAEGAYWNEKGSLCWTLLIELKGLIGLKRAHWAEKSTLGWKGSFYWKGLIGQQRAHWVQKGSLSWKCLIELKTAEVHCGSRGPRIGAKKCSVKRARANLFCCKEKIRPLKIVVSLRINCRSSNVPVGIVKQEKGLKKAPLEVLSNALSGRMQL